MFSWLIVIILSYLFFSLAFFGDKLILSGPPNSKLYTFYVGALSLLVIFFIPFIKLSFPSALGLLWIVLEAIVYILGLYAMFIALEKFDVSRVMTTIGATQPIIILILTWIFLGTVVTGANLLAFIMLLLASIVISMEGKFKITGNYLILLVFSSLMFSLDYIFSKLVFFNMSFLQGIVWMRIFSFLFVLIFLFDKSLRIQIFSKKTTLNKKTGLLFLSTQSAGGIAGLLQSFAISLAPVSYLAIVNSLRGVQYVFLFIITLFFSFFFPKILKEDISKKVILQKTIAIILIVIGLAFLIY
ncbi:MAG: hypothetical protein A2908_01500 [Candidatus Staskawiczbacteria bacterium RIFCSPLOWO2_01_FULL_38_12b]|uniref:EamA domain-containing protein n=1 Tax=Candidatus Staskawiczbacteria bacterium RIFCSPLOWO2_01_FULL_38_12b TaxID=1802214 RepID=A0A1G2IEB3_9BACT|nr:MAG: hypothetical protein A2908_01500 [Candidatus Staskawiczbacteria bacterium RIFCSPLOWO2_01_FULL_38_12b]